MTINMFEIQDIRPNGTVLVRLTFDEFSYPGDMYDYGFRPPGPWKRQTRELPDGEWQTIGGRTSDGAYWRQLAGSPEPDWVKEDWENATS